MNWLVTMLQRRSVLTVWGLYGIQSCFQVCNLWKVYAIFSAGELEESKVRKSKGGDLMKNDGHRRPTLQSRQECEKISSSFLLSLLSSFSREATAEIILQRGMRECMVISGDSKWRLFLVCGEEEGGGCSLHWGWLREMSSRMGRSRACYL